VKEITEEEGISIARACKLIMLVRSMYYYESVKDDSEVEAKLNWYAEKLPARGFPEYFKRIRGEGLCWNHKRVRRVYISLGMPHRRKIKRRIPNPEKKTLLQPTRPNLTWSIDFMEDRLENGRKFRTFNILDDYNREALAIEVDYSFPSLKVIERVKRVLNGEANQRRSAVIMGLSLSQKFLVTFAQPQGSITYEYRKGSPCKMVLLNDLTERTEKMYLICTYLRM